MHPDRFKDISKRAADGDEEALGDFLLMAPAGVKKEDAGAYASGDKTLENTETDGSPFMRREKGAAEDPSESAHQSAAKRELLSALEGDERTAGLPADVMQAICEIVSPKLGRKAPKASESEAVGGEE